MKRGTASRVILGKNTIAEMPGGVFVGTDVILGKKDGLTNDFNGLVLSNTVMFGKKVSHAAIISVIVRGANRIVLPDAIANSLSYVKAFGGTEQNGTPTPDAPVDIVCNNGVLKARHQSGLPLGYTLVESIGFTGAQYINTGLAINNNTRVLFDVKRSISSAQSNYPWLGGARDYVNNTSINKKTLEFSKSDSTRMYLQYATAGEITIFVPNTTQRHTYDFDKNKLYVDENLIYTATQETFTGNAAFLIGTIYSQNSVSTASMFYGNVYGFKLWQDGTNLSMNLIPAKRNSDNVLGMYDTVSGTFFTNAGTGDFVAGNPVDDLEIYTDGTVETINAHGKNLINNDACRRYEEEDDVPTTNRYGWLITLPAGTYTISQGAGNTSYVRYSADNGSTWSSYATISENVSRTYTFDTETLMYVYGTGSDGLETQKAKKVQLELGSTATEYAPYYDGGTATTEILLKVGDYQDVQSILDGVVTRNVGVKVLDGSENWISAGYGASSRCHITDDIGLPNTEDLTSPMICSHYGFGGYFSGGGSTTVGTFNAFSRRTPGNEVYYLRFSIVDMGITSASEFKAWLTAQYNAGTPVIVIYPLATATTESVAGQTLQVTGGDNVLEITQASLDGLELEAQYNTQVQLTVQEVENANLDNDVTVTIQ